VVVTLRNVVAPVVPEASRLVSVVVPPAAPPNDRVPVPELIVRFCPPSIVLAKVILAFVVARVDAPPSVTGPP